jgi:hypothetical protein
MAIKFGDSTPSAYYLGSNTVSEVYFGSTKVWPPTANNTLTSMKIITNFRVGISEAGVRFHMNTCFSEVGITAPSISVTNMNIPYTGADLDPSIYDVVLIAPTGFHPPGEPALSDNLKTYMQNGGGVMFNPYVGTGDAGNPGGAGFDAALLPFTNKNVPAETSGTNKILRVDDATHPIITSSAVSTGDFLAQSSVYVPFQFSEVRSGATVLCSQNADSVPYVPWVTVHTYAGVSRCVYHNYFFPQAQNVFSIPIETKRLIVHSLRWAAGVI